jgi:hypothetical protein
MWTSFRVCKVLGGPNVVDKANHIISHKVETNNFVFDVEFR